MYLVNISGKSYQHSAKLAEKIFMVKIDNPVERMMQRKYEKPYQCAWI